ncbi:MAG: hypothetical protein RLZ55_265 [Actinomycetota bacterium]|jgi:FkbM family methyltransferase
MPDSVRVIDLTGFGAEAGATRASAAVPEAFSPSPVRLLQLGVRDQAGESGEADWRQYEHPLPEVLVGLASAYPGAFYDVGANSGFYSILLGRLGLTETVVCVEAMPPIATACQRNLTLNQVEASVVQVALSDTTGTATLYIPSDHHRKLETSCSLDPDFKSEATETIEVPTLTLDALHAERAHEHVSLVKIDVEGAEHLVLAGADELLRRERPVLTVEILPRAPFEEVERLLARHEYSLVPLLAHGPGEPTKQARFIEGAWNQAAVPDERLADVLGVIADATAMAGRAVADLDPYRALAIELAALSIERDSLREELESSDERRRATLAEAALEELRTHLRDLQGYIEELRTKEAQLDDLRAHHAGLEPYVLGLQADLAEAQNTVAALTAELTGRSAAPASGTGRIVRKLRAATGSRRA